MLFERRILFADSVRSSASAQVSLHDPFGTAPFGFAPLRSGQAGQAPAVPYTSVMPDPDRASSVFDFSFLCKKQRLWIPGQDLRE